MLGFIVFLIISVIIYNFINTSHVRKKKVEEQTELIDRYCEEIEELKEVIENNNFQKDFVFNKQEANIEIENLRDKTFEFESKITKLVKKKKSIETNIEKIKEEEERIKKILDKINVDYYYDNTVGQDPLTIEDGIYNIDDWNEIDSTYLMNYLKELRSKEKQMSKDERATLKGFFPVANTEKEEERIVKSIKKLILRTFNGECDAVIAKVTHRNLENTQKKIQKSFDDLQKLGSFFGCRISIPYLKYKLKEASLLFDYELKKQQEKEEQKAIREQMREEEKAIREIEKAKKDALMEEKKALDALEKAKKELVNAHGAELDKLQEKLALLENQLKEAEENNQRAISMAQLTKSGHVYVISNIGSFGEQVYKIGMTRRLDPMDRVKELGDASVPFKFDVHAMIYSNNAPELESILHREFEDKRVNKVNRRKEFFRVNLDDIKEKVEANHGEFHLTKLAEAPEYRKTLEMKKEII